MLLTTTKSKGHTMKHIKLFIKLIIALTVGAYRAMTSPVGHFFISIVSILAVYIGVALGWLAGVKYFVTMIVLYFVSLVAFALGIHLIRFLWNRYVNQLFSF